jgi:NADH-quinone oxidoreductase subunit M
MILLFIVFCPLLAALVILLGAPARTTAMAAAGLTLLASIAAFVGFDGADKGFSYVTSVPISAEWRLNFTLGVDGLSLIMVLLTAIVTLAAVWFTGKVEKHEHSFYACLLFIAAGAMGAFASIDMFFFYAFHELALIPTFLLIGIWGSGNRYTAAWKITIYLATGSFILLLGLIMLYRSVPEAARSFDMRVLQAAASAGQISADAQRPIYLLLLIGFGILISLFPFHTWRRKRMPPRLRQRRCFTRRSEEVRPLRPAAHRRPDAARRRAHWAWLLIILLLGNIIYVGLVTIAQKRLDWMLGYSSVMHMGYIFSGSRAEQSRINGAAILIFAHGLSIALLFADRGGRCAIGLEACLLEDLGGLGKVMPLAGLAFGLGAFALDRTTGLRQFQRGSDGLLRRVPQRFEMNGFHIFQVATVLALWGVVISAVYMLRA